MAAKKPIFNTRVASEFGDIENVGDLSLDKLSMQADTTYTPGFSEMRQERDLQILEVSQGTRQGNDVRALPVNVRLVRCSAPLSAKPDGRKLLKNSMKGYRAITKDDVGKEWFKSFPPGAEEMPDGTIRKGDVMYMVADAKQAARNQLAKEQTTAAMVSANDTSTDGLFGVVGQHKGASPSARVISGDGPLSSKEIFAD